jgi:hypothetical protein
MIEHSACSRHEETIRMALFVLASLVVQNEKAPTPVSVGAFFAGGKFQPGLKLHLDHRIVLFVGAGGVERHVRRFFA